MSLLPRVDQFWFKYSYMEEMLGNTDRARQVFERWMQWEPDDQAWNSYVKFEVRAGDMPRARVVHERYLGVHQTLRAFLKVAKWEARECRDPDRARRVGGWPMRRSTETTILYQPRPRGHRRVLLSQGQHRPAKQRHPLLRRH